MDKIIFIISYLFIYNNNIMNTNLKTLEFVLKNYKNFNARATKDALISYWRHIEKGGKMF